MGAMKRKGLKDLFIPILWPLVVVCIFHTFTSHLSVDDILCQPIAMGKITSSYSTEGFSLKSSLQ